MDSDLKTFFYENVILPYKNYLKIKANSISGENIDRTVGLQAATALYHFREHLPLDKRQSHASLMHKCRDYDLLGDIVNLSKHSGSNKSSKSKILSLDNIVEIVISTEYQDKEGVYTDIEKDVLLQLEDGSNRYLSEILSNVYQMWTSFFSEQLNITFKPLVKVKKGLPKRSRKSNKLDLKMVNGNESKKCFKFYKYNYEKEIAEPIDLKDKDIQLNVYVPQYSIHLSIPNPKTGEIKSWEVKVDDKQKVKIERLKTREEKFIFFSKLAVEQGLWKLIEEDGKSIVQIPI